MNKNELLFPFTWVCYSLFLDCSIRIPFSSVSGVRESAYLLAISERFIQIMLCHDQTKQIYCGSTTANFLEGLLVIRQSSSTNFYFSSYICYLKNDAIMDRRNSIDYATHYDRNRRISRSISAIRLYKEKT